jgi:HAD superfamily hydrolase (TIGR01662 family)
MEIILLCGFPASGKSTICQQYPDYRVLSRDVIGGSYKDVLKELKKVRENVIIDGTHLTEDARYPFIEYAKDTDIKIRCLYVESCIEDCMINALRRQWAMNGDICWKGNTTHPHMFSPAVLFKARKTLQVPNEAEGFKSVDVVPGHKPFYDPSIYVNRAIFFDIDGTLRKTDHLPHKYPTCVDEVEPLLDLDKMKKKINKKVKKGYILLGVSNQSGISKGTVSEEVVKECMEKTKEMLDVEMDIKWCPHAPAPISCYCRKPQSGMGVYFIEKYKLDPSKCKMIGDQTTDKTFAERLGMQFIHVSKFF